MVIYEVKFRSKGVWAPICAIRSLWAQRMGICKADHVAMLPSTVLLISFHGLPFASRARETENVMIRISAIILVTVYLGRLSYWDYNPDCDHQYTRWYWRRDRVFYISVCWYVWIQLPLTQLVRQRQLLRWLSVSQPCPSCPPDNILYFQYPFLLTLTKSRRNDTARWTLCGTSHPSCRWVLLSSTVSISQVNAIVFRIHCKAWRWVFTATCPEVLWQSR